jgi:hypothetical protein
LAAKLSPRLIGAAEPDASCRFIEFTANMRNPNTPTAYAFRNGFLEDLHAAKPSPILEQPGFSRISDEEMRKLMIEASGKMEELLRLKREQPGK